MPDTTPKPSPEEALARAAIYFTAAAEAEDADYSEAWQALRAAALVLRDTPEAQE
jgi:hypothetical protein